MHNAARVGAPAKQVDTLWFKNLLADRDLSQRQLAKRLQLDPAAVSLLLRGKRKILLEEIERLAQVLDVPLIDVLQHAGLPEVGGEVMRRIPVAGALNGAGEVEFEAPRTTTYVDAPGDVPHDTLALVARTAGSPLSHIDGAVLFTVKRASLAECLQRLCVVKPIDADSPVLATIRRGLARDTYRIELACRPPVENARIEWASPILWLRP